MSKLYTIGYAGHSPQWIVDQCKKENIKTIFDIRINPKSRIVEYNRNNLARFFMKNDLVYNHVPEGGNPFYKEKRSDSLESLYRPYVRDEHIAKEFLFKLRNIYRGQELWPIVLMCACSNANRCHRGILADEIHRESEKLQIVHLPVKRKSQINLFGGTHVQ